MLNQVSLQGILRNIKSFTTKTNKTVYRFEIEQVFAPTPYQPQTKHFYIPCFKWGKLSGADGSEVVIEGILETREITTKAGKPFRVIEVNCQKMTEAQSSQAIANAEEVFGDDDLAF